MTHKNILVAVCDVNCIALICLKYLAYDIQNPGFYMQLTVTLFLLILFSQCKPSGWGRR